MNTPKIIVIARLKRLADQFMRHCLLTPDQWTFAYRPESLDGLGGLRHHATRPDARRDRFRSGSLVPRSGRSRLAAQCHHEAAGVTDTFYAGVGSRETPSHVLVEMVSIARKLRERGWTLRSGGAPGADIAFGAGAGTDSRIYLPWSGFNGQEGIVVGSTPDQRAIAERHHPAWRRLSPGAQMLHTRNVHVVLGYWPEAVRSKFVVCWTPGGLGGGGTGQAIRIARAYGIPVYDLASDSQRADFYGDWLADEE